MVPNDFTPSMQARVDTYQHRNDLIDLEVVTQPMGLNVMNTFTKRFQNTFFGGGIVLPLTKEQKIKDWSKWFATYAKGVGL